MQTPVRSGVTPSMTRFLGLRKVFRFQKYSLAPTPIANIKLQRGGVNIPGPTRSKRAALLPHSVTGGVRDLATFRPPPSMGRLPGNNATGNGISAHVAKRQETVATDAGGRRTRPPSHNSTIMSRTILGPARAPRATLRGAVFQSSINRSIFVMPKSDLDRTTGFAPPRSAAEPSAGLVLPAAAQAVPYPAIDRRPAAGSPTTPQPFAFRFGSPGSTPISAADSSGAADYGIPPAPQTGMLHIDGTALGRWTVQHLVRTLGRPSTGMTGVDPRATLPRSRVAPF